MERAVDRRTILKIGGILASVAILGILSEFNPRNSTLQPKNTAEKIKDFEKELGDSPLSLDQARNFVPLISSLFYENTGWQQSSDIQDHTFIFYEKPPYPQWYYPNRMTELELWEIKQSNWFNKLTEIYPNLLLTKGMAEDITSAYWQSSTGAIFKEGNIFLFLDRENSLDELRGGIVPFQYQKLSPTVECLAPTPAAQFRSAFLHEISHRDIAQDSLPAEDELVTAFSKYVDSFAPFTSASKKGFRIDLFSPKWGGNVPIKGFEEFFASYVAAKISLDNGLNYATPPTPTDLFNFEVILKQAKISFDEVLALHREAMVKEFLIKVGGSAQNSDRDALELGVLIASRGLSWNIVKNYFPEVDTVESYRRLNIRSPIVFGCSNTMMPTIK